MPILSAFYGLVVMMFFLDNKKHSKPHVHVKYQDEMAVIGIPNGEVIEGSLPVNRLKLVQAWIEIHKEELMTDWSLAVAGQEIFKIEPLR
ncbi:MAG TPA: DUF4160 domain-containing protein [bacterium]|nr:DUF4160 domain-containing protein [bacterium]